MRFHEKYRYKNGAATSSPALKPRSRHLLRSGIPTNLQKRFGIAEPKRLRDKAHLSLLPHSRA